MPYRAYFEDANFLFIGLTLLQQSTKEEMTASVN